MPARLVPLKADSAPIVWLQRPVVLIGRHPECDVRIDLPQVSRRHCCLALAYDRMLVRDLGSRNGVRVNGRLVEEATLQPGDEIAIAQVIYRLEDAPTGTRQSASATSKSPTVSTPPADIPELPGQASDVEEELIPLDELLP
jgi:pSer/pThr/pTyr-binding forkhead associated (FHA) protein